MQNNNQPDRARGIWRFYSSPKRGRIALWFLVLCLLIESFFSDPDFMYRGPGTPGILSLQLAFTVSKFREILLSWRDIALFKQSVWQIDYLFPITYAGMLAFGYAWSRRNEEPARLDRVMFLAPFVAASCDWIENSLHLYLLRNVNNKEQVEATSFSDALVFAASSFALIKIGLLILTAVAIVGLLVCAFFNISRDDITSIQKNIQRGWDRLTFIYWLRFPVITAISLGVLVYISFFTGARALLENIFDLRTFGIYIVTLVAFLIAWTTMVTLRLLLLYGPERFGVTIDYVPKIFRAVPKKFGWG